MFHIALIGYLAGLIVAVSLIPQLIKTLKTRSTKDISLLWTLVYISGLILWVVYGIGIKSLPLMTTVTVELTLAASLLFLKLKYSQS